MAIEEAQLVALLSEFCVDRRVANGTRITVADSLDEALWQLSVKGPDNRWKTINARAGAGDVPDSVAAPRSAAIDRSVYEVLLRRQRHTRFSQSRLMRPWFLRHVVVSVAHWARFSRALASAYQLGACWLVPANKHVLIVPRPTLRFAEGSAHLLHEDTGKKAIEWPDGTGYYFLRGTEFNKGLYSEVIRSQLTLTEICRLENADQRSIAITYLSFQRLVVESNSELLDRGVKGTALYRLRLPPQIATDRSPGYGGYDYFIHMRDASHPEREFVEWVDPRIGAKRNAELCQAEAFGITLDEWLSIRQEG